MIDDPHIRGGITHGSRQCSFAGAAFADITNDAPRGAWPCTGSTLWSDFIATVHCHASYSLQKLECRKPLTRGNLCGIRGKVLQKSIADILGRHNHQQECERTSETVSLGGWV